MIVRLRYSIVIPVFNKADLTRNCLTTLLPTLAPAGDGEVIVIDNASTDNTAQMLSEFPWVRVVSNDRNLGFAGANNQGAQLAQGRFLVLLNNDTQPLAGWLNAMLTVAEEPGIGAVGARLLYPDSTVQHAGVVVSGVFFSGASFLPYHHLQHFPQSEPGVLSRRDYQIVTAACMVTPRETYLELGGLNQTYWNGYEDVDYCLALRARGLRVVYEPAATLYHFESQSGTQRFRRVWANMAVLEDRWHGAVTYDAGIVNVREGRLRTLVREPRGSIRERLISTPAATIVVHGLTPGVDRIAFEGSLRANRTAVERVVWCEDAARTVADARTAMQLRGERFLAFVRADADLHSGWLDELVAQIASLPSVAAATFAPELPVGENVATLAADARCTLLFLRAFPQHLTLADSFDTLDGAVADLLLRTLAQAQRGVRGASRTLGTVGPTAVDPAFERTHGIALTAVFDTAPSSVQRVLERRELLRRGLVSIVTLSWNAPSFTKKALESIAECTSEPYEVIVVDNGSGDETKAMLAAIDDPHVRIVYNPINRGYAGGNNDGIAQARGDFVVLLNNDVVVTSGWLDGLLDAFARMPGLGVSAPRSNLVVGHQQLNDALYANETDLKTYAADRSDTWARTGYVADRAIGLCLCIDRRVIEQIGGLDERFGLGNFEDDDYCIRVRAAGYGIYVCDDVFIHHFGSRSFAANNVDYSKTMHENWGKFAAKWGFPGALPANGYQPEAAFVRGFDPSQHFVELPRVQQAARPDRSYDATFYAAVRNENDWVEAAEFVKRFARAFKPEDRAVFWIGVFGELAATTIGGRVERALKRIGIEPERSPDIEISDEDDAHAWIAELAHAPGARDIAALDDRSPSALRRLIEPQR